ncbi:MAG: hypothetical protein KAG53_05855 [Endozoicomonadaceae bacterium]|nr:hypothetical protein [Endozoicomonadaceae bacterium]
MQHIGSAASNRMIAVEKGVEALNQRHIGQMIPCCNKQWGSKQNQQEIVGATCVRGVD